MPIYISMLRGINVSGQKMIKMDALRTMCEGLNFKNAQTYIQSGNVVFQYQKTNIVDLEKIIAKKIRDTFSFEVPVMIKEVDALKTILKDNPFVNNRMEDISKLHVTFLSQEPDQSGINNINSGAYIPDEFILTGKTIYLFCPNGYGRTKLTNNFFESKFKVVATTRNWKTLNELINIAEGI